MKLKDLPILDKPSLYQLDLDNIQDFISLYKDCIDDKRFTVLPADSSCQVGFVAYYEKGGKEYGYGIRTGCGKAFSFLRKKNAKLKESQKWWNIHHYLGTDNPIQRIAEENIKEIDIALNQIQNLRKRYPKLKNYLDGKLKRILDFSNKTTKGNK